MKTNLEVFIIVVMNMNISSEIVLLICGIGAIQSYFLSLYILTQKNKKDSSIFLGLLFLMLAIRVSKSVLWAFWPDTPLWVLNLGFAAHTAIGPLLLLYILCELKMTQAKKWFHTIHFLPGFLILLLSPGLSGFWYNGGYSLLLYHNLFYILLGLGILFYGLSRSKERSLDYTWYITLCIGVFLWSFAYFSNYILRLTSYMLGPLVYSVIIYALSFYGLRKQGLFSRQKEQKKYRNINLSEEDADRLLSKVMMFMDEKPYLENDFNLDVLSDKIKIPKHILSHLFSEKLSKSFPEFINKFRVEESKIRLKDPQYDHQTIASVAYDCGFNSLSSFNNAFKKFEKKTPSQYRLEATA